MLEKLSNSILHFLHAHHLQVVNPGGGEVIACGGCVAVCDTVTTIGHLRNIRDRLENQPTPHPFRRYGLKQGQN